MTGLSRTAWTPAEDERLAKLREQGVKMNDLHLHMPGRGFHVCQDRAKMLGLNERPTGFGSGDAALASKCLADATIRAIDNWGQARGLDVDQAAARLLSGVEG